MTPGGLVIRAATEADCPTITEIYAQTVEARDATMDLAPRPAGYFAGVIASLGDRERFVVLEREGELLGYGRIMAYSDRAGYRPAAETAVYLRRELRRQGLGSYLKRWVLEECRRLGYHHLVAKVYACNQASIEYNRRFGYELVGIQREIGWVGGRWEDVAIMQLVLDDVPPPDDPG
jgi:phosphinothricin acetyltransferase